MAVAKSANRMGDTEMTRILLLLLAMTAVSGCLPVALGAVGAVAADKVVEKRRGDEGLF